MALSRLAGVVLGVLNLVIGALLIFGGVQEAAAYWGQDVPSVLLGIFGATTSAVFAFAGALLVANKPLGKTLCIYGGIAMFIVHGIGKYMSNVGWPAFLLGCVYSLAAALIVWSKTRTNNAEPRRAGAL